MKGREEEQCERERKRVVVLYQQTERMAGEADAEERVFSANCRRSTTNRLHCLCPAILASLNPSKHSFTVCSFLSCDMHNIGASNSSYTQTDSISFN